MIIQGPVTGTKYHFSGLQRIHWIDPRDALSLIRNPLFVMEGIVEKSEPTESSPEGEK